MAELALLVWFAVTVGTFSGSTSGRPVPGSDGGFPAAPVPAGSSLGARENLDKGRFPDSQIARTQGPSCTDCEPCANFERSVAHPPDTCNICESTH
jgi:hypothetical protein